jgi:hypothetical protein
MRAIAAVSGDRSLGTRHNAFNLRVALFCAPCIIITNYKYMAFCYPKLVARRRQLRYWPPFSLPDISSRALWREKKRGDNKQSPLPTLNTALTRLIQDGVLFLSPRQISREDRNRERKTQSREKLHSTVYFHFLSFRCSTRKVGSEEKVAWTVATLRTSVQ